MFLDEYDYETDIAVKQEEAKAEGAQQNAKESTRRVLAHRRVRMNCF